MIRNLLIIEKVRAFNDVDSE